MNKKKICMYIFPIIYVVMCFILYSWSSNYVTSINNGNNVYKIDNYTYIQLTDPLLEVIGKTNRYNYYKLYVCINIIPWIFIFIYLFIQIMYIIKEKKEEYIIYALFGEGILILPNANNLQQACFDKKKDTTSKWIFKVITANTCGDMIWSGHTVHLIFALYFSYKIINLQIWKYKLIYCSISTLLVIFEIIGLVTFQVHYSVDVFLSLIIAPLFLTRNEFYKFIKNYKKLFENKCNKDVVCPSIV